MSYPIGVELLDKNHKVLYTNVYHSIRWAKKCIEELNIDYAYIRITSFNRFNNKMRASALLKIMKEGRN